MAVASRSREPVSEQVFRELLEGLLAGRYRPGEKLPTQRALAAQAGVTMGTVREALKRLEQMGLVDVRHGDAMRARDWREHGGLDLVAHLFGARPARDAGTPALDAGLLGDVFEARRLMLRELAALAAQRREPGQAARLADLAGAIAAAPDAAAAQPLDFAFFAQVAEAAGNLVFLLIMNSIRELYFAQAEQLPVTARHRELAPLYARAAEAIALRDTAAARAAVAELADRQRARVEEALGR